MAETVEAGKVAILTFQIRTEAGKTLIDTGSEPFAYLHGRGGLVPGLEKALEGKEAGEEISVVLTPEEGYGLKSGPGPQPVPRSEFRRDVAIQPGVAFRVAGTDGEEITLYVTKVLGSKVWVDRNHPFAGETLHIDARVLGVRDATYEEAQHGHAHGITGQHGH
ncbi:MAG: peptidylprolyl isomerase [Deltaproteobacteria bacterium]|nr:peptidylprolyl isomerase [Deltaproteobacteria bacterium]